MQYPIRLWVRTVRDEYWTASSGQYIDIWVVSYSNSTYDIAHMLLGVRIIIVPCCHITMVTCCTRISVWQYELPDSVITIWYYDYNHCMTLYDNMKLWIVSFAYSTTIIITVWLYMSALNLNLLYNTYTTPFFMVSFAYSTTQTRSWSIWGDQDEIVDSVICI